jgi:restriction system protein
MPVPDFQSWFFPLLRRVADGEVHKIADLYGQLADDMGWAEEDRRDFLKSGGQYVYENRIGWARTYLKNAGLLQSPARGLVQITNRGRGVLSENPVLGPNRRRRRWES